ncbi:MAG: hypothetical protein HZA89_05635 [Verrucomicrobia bacterium]|nr:hypothetical protein [Verrucomicrobiota bacterium]
MRPSRSGELLDNPPPARHPVRQMKRGCSILFALLFSVATHAGDPLDTWHWRNPVPLGVPLYGVCFGNDLFVAVGNAGTVLVSPDGANWVARTTDTYANLRDIAYGDGLYVAVGDTGTILTSSDTKVWMSQATSAFADLNSVTYGGGQFVAVGDASFILSSANGTNWLLRASGTIPLLDVTYANGLFVAVGSQGGFYVPWGNVTLTSTDGVVWTSREPLVSGLLKAVTYGNNRFVAVVYGQPYSDMTSFISSIDGIHWENQADAIYNYGGINTLAYGNGVFTTYAGSPSVYAIVHWRSEDGLKWSQVPTEAYSAIQSATFGQDRFVAVGGTSDSYAWSSFILTVSSSSNFHSRVKGGGLYGGSHPASHLVHTGDKFFAFAGFEGYNPDYGNTVAVSSNGTFWTTSLVHTNWGIKDVVFGGSEYVGVGIEGKTATSSNGFAWTLRETGEGKTLEGITWGKGQYVAVGAEGTVMTSSNARNWASHVQPASNNLVQVAFANEFFACLDYNEGSVLVSADGVVWNQQPLTNSGVLRKLRSIGNYFVGLGDWGRVVTSVDGVSWKELRPSQTNTPYYDLTYANGTFVLVGGNYNGQFWRLLTSTDGTNWTQRTISGVRDLLSVAYGSGTFVVGGTASILQSDPLTNTAPALAAAPATVFPMPGSEATLSVLATGSSPLSFQWLRDGASITGAEEPFLYLTNPPTTFTNQFSVVVSNAFGAITSAPVSVVVGVPAALGLGKDAVTQLSIAGTPGRRYRVECADSISPGTTWTVLTNLILSSTQEIVTDSSAESSTKRFYRAVLVP